MADLITVRFMLRYVTRPLHLFGPIGFSSVAAGTVAGTWIAATKLLTGAPVFVAHGPVLLLSAVLIQTGIVLIGLGLLAELLTRIYMDGRRRRIYTVARPKTRAARQVWAGPRPVSVHPKVLQ
jgi:sugar (pentulose or hexulose) kinase